MNGKRILLVDDEDAQVFNLRRLLRKKGARVSDAATMDEACRELRRNHFDCIVADLKLPDSTQDETINRIPVLAEYAPVVVFTGTDNDDHRHAAMTAGAAGYKLKGVSIEEVFEAIGNAIERAHPDAALAQTVSRTRRESITKAYNDKQDPWFKRHRNEILVVLAILGFAFPQIKGLIGFITSGAKQEVSDENWRAKMEDRWKEEKDARVEADKSLTENLSKLTTHVDELWKIAEGVRNENSNLKGDYGRLDKKVDDMRGELGANQHRMERNQIKLLIKNGITPATDEDH
jgi:DNA-binding NarL/FixJ family response regulator